MNKNLYLYQCGAWEFPEVENSVHIDDGTAMCHEHLTPYDGISKRGFVRRLTFFRLSQWLEMKQPSDEERARIEEWIALFIRPHFTDDEWGKITVWVQRNVFNPSN